MAREEELCQYFKKRSFYELMFFLKERYEKTGTISGSLWIKVTQENKDDLEMFMSETYSLGSFVKISVSRIRRILSKTKYFDVDLEKVIELYFDQKIVTKKETIEKKNEMVVNLIHELATECEGSKASRWIQDCVKERNTTYIRLVQEALTNRNKVKRAIQWAMKGINELPLQSETMSIAVFASQITKDPHGFDKGTLARYLLIKAINYELNLTEDYPEMERLALVGLYEDRINNFCAICHINGIKEDGHTHPGWNGFYQDYEMWNMNIHNISCIKHIDNRILTDVFVVENPAVFEVLCQEGNHQNYECYGFVCTNGQLHASAYHLLDEITKVGIQIHYAGDYDPEGLLIADKIKSRYKELCNLWRYSVEDYLEAISHKKATQIRLKSLKLITDKDLVNIAELLPSHGIGYQENILNLYLEDLRRIRLNSPKLGTI